MLHILKICKKKKKKEKKKVECMLAQVSLSAMDKLSDGLTK